MSNVKVALDTLPVRPGSSGAVGVFRNMLHWGPKYDDSAEFIVFVYPEAKVYYNKFTPSANAEEQVHFRVFDYPQQNRLARLWIQNVLIPRECRRYGVDIHFSLNPEPFFGIGQVQEVFKPTGLQFYHVPDQLGRLETIYQRVMAPRKARRSDLVIANSEYTRQDILERIKVPEERVRVVYEAVDHTVFYHEENVTAHRRKLREQFGIDFPYILDVSDLRPYKNPIALLRAYDLLVMQRNIPHHLVLVGNDMFGYQAEVERAVHEASLTDRVHIFGYIHHWDLVSFYHGASVLVYPSELETFGTPPLEAMACGVPVIVSDVSAVPEVSGGGAVVVDPHDAGMLADAIHRVLTDAQFRDEWVQKGLKWCKQYSWERNVRETMRLLRELVQQ